LFSYYLCGSRPRKEILGRGRGNTSSYAGRRPHRKRVCGPSRGRRDAIVASGFEAGGTRPSLSSTPSEKERDLIYRQLSARPIRLRHVNVTVGDSRRWYRRKMRAARPVITRTWLLGAEACKWENGIYSCGVRGVRAQVSFMPGLTRDKKPGRCTHRAYNRASRGKTRAGNIKRCWRS